MCGDPVLKEKYRKCEIENTYVVHCQQAAFESTFICWRFERYKCRESQRSEKIAFLSLVDTKQINILWQFNLINNYFFPFAIQEWRIAFCDRDVICSWFIFQKDTELRRNWNGELLNIFDGLIKILEMIFCYMFESRVCEDILVNGIRLLERSLVIAKTWIILEWINQNQNTWFQMRMNSKITCKAAWSF